MFRIILTLFMVLATTLSLNAQRREPIPLEELVKRLVEVNYQLQMQNFQTQKAHQNITLAPVLPSLNATARQQQNAVNTTTNTLSIGASLNWRLFDGLAMFHTLALQKQQLTVAELNERDRLQGLVAEVANQYYMIISLRNRIVMARQSIALSQKRYDNALYKYTIGSGSGLEAQLAQIDLNADSSALIKHRENLDMAYITLNSRLNYPLELRDYVSDTIIMMDKINLDTIRNITRENNFQIQLAKQGELISDIDLRLAKSVLYPTLDFAAGYNYSAVNQRPSSDFTNSLGPNWGFTVGVTLFNGLENQRKIKNARTDLRISQVNREYIESQVLSALLSQYTNYSNNVMQINFEVENAKTSLLNLEVALYRYNLGELSGIDFRSVQQQYLAAEDRKINVIYQAKASEINLLTLASLFF